MQNTKQHELSIISVYYSERSRAILELNGDIMRKLNPDMPYVWYAGDNSPKDYPVSLDSAQFVRAPGVSYEELEAVPAPHMRGGFHHAAALHKILQEVKTRFVLILDYDFFIVRIHALRDVLDHMQKNNLTFFGSVWHPRYYAKYRYFPSVHCLFIDCSRADCTLLDFRPDRTLKKKEIPGKGWILFSRLPKIVQRIFLAATFQDRKFIGSSGDTGHSFFRAYNNRPGVKVGYIQPVLKPREHFGRFASSFYYPNRFFEWFLPDHLSFIPKQKEYFSKKGFHDLGYPNITRGQKKWEEYLWQGRPFGVHLRGTHSDVERKNKNDFENEIKFLKRSFQEFIPLPWKPRA